MAGYWLSTRQIFIHFEGKSLVLKSSFFKWLKEDIFLPGQSGKSGADSQSEDNVQQKLY